VCKPRPPLFKWRHFEPAIITWAVGWYLRFSLSYRDVEALLTERGTPADHSSNWRWVQCYAPELNKRCRRERKPTNGSWRVDETYVRVKGKWVALRAPGHPRPRVIKVDGNPSYPKVVAELKTEGKLGRRCRCRTCPYLNNLVEQDHRAIKRRVNASQGFGSFHGALRTIQGYAAVHMIRKGQVTLNRLGSISQPFLQHFHPDSLPPRRTTARCEMRMPSTLGSLMAGVQPASDGTP